MNSRRYLDCKGIRIELKTGVRLRITLSDGQVFDEVEPRRMFPITNANKYISIVDSKGDELFIIKDLTQLDAQSRENLSTALERFYLIPKIREIKGVEEKFGLLLWKVKTDRGDFEFDIQNRHSDIKLLSNGRVLIRDSNDNRYEITNYSKLPRKSKYLLAGDL